MARSSSIPSYLHFMQTGELKESKQVANPAALPGRHFKKSLSDIFLDIQKSKENTPETKGTSWNCIPKWDGREEQIGWGSTLQQVWNALSYPYRTGQKKGPLPLVLRKRKRAITVDAKETNENKKENELPGLRRWWKEAGSVVGEQLSFKEFQSVMAKIAKVSDEIPTIKESESLDEYVNNIKEAVNAKHPPLVHFTVTRNVDAPSRNGATYWHQELVVGYYTKNNKTIFILDSSNRYLEIEAEKLYEAANHEDLKPGAKETFSKWKHKNSDTTCWFPERFVPDAKFYEEIFRPVVGTIRRDAFAGKSWEFRTRIFYFDSKAAQTKMSDNQDNKAEASESISTPAPSRSTTTSSST